MRILILPLVIVSLCCSNSVFSQTGLDCVDAIDVSASCGTPVAMSAATQAGPVGTCNPGGNKKITWFKFTAGATCPAISFDLSNNTMAFEVSAYSACPVGAAIANATVCLTGSGVWSPSAAAASSFINGNVYYLRVWANTTTTGTTIRACNISDNANPLSSGCSSVTISPVTGLPVGTCTPGGQKAVTWFKFTADNTCPMLSIDNSASTPATPVPSEVSVYPACGNATSSISPIAALTSCVANGSIVWTPPVSTPLVVGNTYYLRVWTNLTAPGTNRLNICNIANVAQDLPLDASCNDYEQSYAASGGTVSSIASCPMASNPNRRITWIRFQTSAPNQCVTVNITNLGVKTEVAMYGSGCGAAVTNGTSLCLNDGVGVWSAGPGFPANGYTPAKPYYLRVYSDIAPGSSYQPISLCGTEKAQAINDACVNAAAFNYSAGQTYNNACAHFTPTGTPPEGLSSSGPDANKICAFSLQNTVWYKFAVRDGSQGQASVKISNIDCDSYNNSNQLLQMGLLTGNCGSLSAAIAPGPTSGTAPSTSSPTRSCLASSGGGPFELYTSSSITTGQIIYLAIDGYSGANCRFTLQASQNIQPIPIHLKYFTAWKMKTTNLIRWVTSYEHNNAYFDIERSIDGVNFESIGRIPGTESQTDKVYDFEDKFPPANAYYRLKQVDFDGKYEYSDIVQLIRNENIRLAVSVMPNPVLNTGRVVISAEKNGNVNLNIVDMAGRQVSADIYGCVKGSNLFVKDFSKLPSGTYHLVISQDGVKAIKTFVKQ